METIDCRNCSLPLFEKNVPESKITTMAEGITVKKTIWHAISGPDIIDVSYVCPRCGHKDAWNCELKGGYHGR